MMNFTMKQKSMGFLVKQGQNMHNPKLYLHCVCVFANCILYQREEREEGGQLSRKRGQIYTYIELHVVRNK